MFSYLKHDFWPFLFCSKIHKLLQIWPQWKSAIKLIKINIVMLFKSLYYIILKVEENKVTLEF